MNSQVINFGNIVFCTVFEVNEGQAKVAAWFSAGQPEVRAWLAQNDYPTPTEWLRPRQGANLAEGYYIRPFMTDRFFRYHENGDLEELNQQNFEESVAIFDQF